MVRLDEGWAQVVAVMSGGAPRGDFAKPRTWCMINQRAYLIPNAGSTRVTIARPMESLES